MNIITKLKTLSRVDIINYLILIYAFSLSLPQGLKRFTAILMILLWLTDQKKYTLPIIAPIKIFVLFIFMSLLSITWSEYANPVDILNYVRTYWHYLPLFIIYKYLKEENISLSITFFLSGIFISEILSYGNFFNIWQVGYGTASDPTVFYNHTQYSIFLAVSSLLIYIKILHEENNLSKFLLILFLISVTMNLLINGGRTGQIAFFITIIFSILYIHRFNFKFILAGILIVISLLFLSYEFSPIFKDRFNLISVNINKAIDNNDFTSSIGGRLGFYIVAKDLIVESPILGQGTNSHVQASQKIIENKYPELAFTSTLSHTHNQYLEIIFQLGLVGLFLFLLIIYNIFSLKIKDTELDFIKFSTMSLFLVGSFAEVLFHLHGTISLFSFIIGVTFAKHRIEQIR